MTPDEFFNYCNQQTSEISRLDKFSSGNLNFQSLINILSSQASEFGTPRVKVELPNFDQNISELIQLLPYIGTQYRYCIVVTPFTNIDQTRTIFVEFVSKALSLISTLNAWFSMSLGERFIYEKIK